MHLPKVTRLAPSIPGPLAHVCLTPSMLVISMHAVSQHVWPSSELLKTGARLNLPLRGGLVVPRETEMGQTGSWVQTQGPAGS